MVEMRLTEPRQLGAAAGTRGEQSVAQDAEVLGTRERRAPAALLVLDLVHGEQTFQGNVPEPSRAGMEARFVGGASEALVPGADLLAVVTAEEPRGGSLLEVVGDGPAVLDRLVRDAAPGVDHVGAGEGVGGTGALTARAGAAEILVRPVVGLHFPVEDEPGQEDPAPLRARDEAAVLADPTQSCALRPRLLGQETEVHGAVGANARVERVQPSPQPAQLAH